MMVALPGAQGGISAVMDDNDSIEQHMEDTIDAGAGLCDESAVLHTVSHGKEMITWLLDLGVEFTYETGSRRKKISTPYT